MPYIFSCSPNFYNSIRNTKSYPDDKFSSRMKSSKVGLMTRIKTIPAT